MKVLVINCGSSSIKYRLYEMDGERLIARGLVERIGLPDGLISFEGPVGSVEGKRVNAADHTQGMRLALDSLVESGAIRDVAEIDAVGHRVVQGGEKFTEPVLVDEEVVSQLEAFGPLAPVHAGPNTAGIRACMELIPAPQVAVVDTAFHQTLPPKAYLYGIPYELYEKHGIRKYGFHGTSHRYVSRRAAELLGRPLQGFRVITCHLGNGASVAAVKDGKSVDTSMGLTPLEGVVMGTRSGDLDPAVVFYLMKKEGMSADEVNDFLNKKCGLLGLAGIGSADFRDVYAAASSGNERARLALEVYAYRVRKYIGAYMAAMGGTDAVVFTAGIGENNAFIRKEICGGLEELGIVIDEERNESGQPERIISADDSRVAVLVVPTNEELLIARDTARLVASRRA